MPRNNWRQPPEHDRTAFTYDSDEGIRNVIGDSRRQGFTPQISFTKWDGECSLKVRLPSPPSERVPEIDEDQKIEIDYNTHRHRWFVKTDENINQFEAFEWEIIFPSKPLSNIIEYNIETENLSFYLQILEPQPPHPVNMPDNVIGSYAVYHSSKAHNKYKTGKVCHIYRPKAIDASSHEVWCDLFIDPVAGILRITVPQDFIDNAVYPIIIDPTFGYTTLGGAEVGVLPNWCYAALLAADFYTASAGDNVNELFVGLRSPNESGDDMAMAIYTIFKSAPKSKVMESSRFACSNSSTWYSVVVDQDLDDGETYCVAAGEFSAGTWWLRYDYDIVGASENGSTFPVTWSGVAVPHRFSMYAEYTEAVTEQFIYAPVLSYSLSAPVATISPTGSASITPLALAYILAAIAPSLSGSGATTITAPVLSYALSLISPSISPTGSANIVPSPLTYALSSPAPSISGSGSASITAPVLTYTLSVEAPSISGSGTAGITAPILTYVLSIIAPTVNYTQYIQAPALALSLSAPAPAISGSGTANITSPVLTYSLSAISPAISGAGSVSISAPVLSYALSVIAPENVSAGAQYIEAPVLSFALSSPTPSVAPSGSASITAPVLALTLSVPAPSISGSGSVSIAPSVQSYILSIIAAEVSTGEVGIQAPVLNLSLTIVAPSISGSGSASIIPMPLEITLYLISPAVTPGEVTVSAPCLDYTLNIVSPVVAASGVAEISAPALAFVLEIAAPTISAGIIFIEAPVLSYVLSLNLPWLITIEAITIDNIDYGTTESRNVSYGGSQAGNVSYGPIRIGNVEVS